MAESQPGGPDVELRRSHMVVALTIIAAICLVFTVINGYLGHIRSTALLAASCITALLLCFAARRVSDVHVSRVGHAAVGILVFVVTVIALLRGQAESYALLAYIIVPLLAAHLLDVRAAVAWTVVAAMCVIGVYASEAFVELRPDGPPPTRFDKLYVLLIVLATACALASAARRVSDRHQNALHEREQTIRRQTDELEYRVSQRTAELARLNSALTHQALHDELTGLANRALFLDHLAHAHARRGRSGRSVSVLFIDLDRFKVINDSLGHAAGDSVLREVGTRLHRGLRPTDVIARLGGDEFAVLVEDLEQPGEALNVAARIHALFHQPFQLEGQAVFVTASVGIAVTTESDDATEDLLRHADLAMYRAKRHGRNRSEIYDEHMRVAAVRRMQVESALHGAIDHRELRVVYQPIVDVRTGDWVSFEALLRWQRRDGELVGAGDFVGVAEETGLIVPMGDWILHEACRQVVAWREATGRDLGIHVNLSPRQLDEEDLRSVVADAIGGSLDPTRLCLELTETALTQSTAASRAQLDDIKAMGVRLGLDDFGTGYSSLSHLRSFPIDVLKVDKMFIDGLGSDGESTTLVAAIIGLAHSLDLTVIAEGVEHASQAEALQALDCDLAQGFHFGKPASQWEFPGDEAGAGGPAAPEPEGAVPGTS
ncbi:MAG: EAL domain-containing protein [Acidimicrobiia bacterium]|nr:EAL domain-containing protein [Acidimicrobiia bacterium]